MIFTHLQIAVPQSPAETPSAFQGKASTNRSNP